MIPTSHSPSGFPLEPEDAPYQRLIADLRSLEKISAPDDFEYRLKQRIASEPLKPTQWWKRVFSFDHGNLMGVPSYAYGSLVVVLVAVLSIYIYRASNNPPELFTPTLDGTEAPSSSLPDKTLPPAERSTEGFRQPASEDLKRTSLPNQSQEPTGSHVKSGTNKVQSDEAKKESAQPESPLQRKVLAPTESEEHIIQQALPTMRSVHLEDEKNDQADSLKTLDSILKADSLIRINKSIRGKKKNQPSE